MNLQFIPYEAGHLAGCFPLLPTEEAAKGVIPGLSFSAVHDGVVIGAAGLLPRWPGYAVAWVLTGVVPLRAWPAITRETRRILEAGHNAGFRRIEMTARADDPPANRWARKLGFKPYAALHLYGPNGEDHVGYVKIRGDV